MARTEEVQAALAYLAGLAKFGIKPTLERMHYMMQALGDPHRAYSVVHVAGTNGKGSTARMIAQTLQEAGFTTGLFTSPHLEKYNERIAVNGDDICDDDLLALLDEMKPLALRTADEVGHPTEFEMSTAMAFAYFAHRQVDVAVVEVGMGGLWDSTNVVDPALSVITPIGTDHMDRLGTTLAAIAEQKAGIIKQSRPAVIAPQKPEALSVLHATAQQKQADLYSVLPELPASEHTGAVYKMHSIGSTGGSFDLIGPYQTWERLQVQLLGRHQVMNGAVAATACQVLANLGWPIKEAHVRRGLKSARWPGRMEVIGQEPLVLLDGAHNTEAVEVLADSLAGLFTDKRIVFVIGALAEKPIREELRLLLPVAGSVVCTAPALGRTPPLAPGKLAELVRETSLMLGKEIPISFCDNAWEAVQAAVAAANREDVVCVCGSLYLVGEIRGAWRKAKQEKVAPTQ